MVKYFLLISYLLTISFVTAQDYKKMSDSYFTVGDSIRVDAKFVFDRLECDSLNIPIQSKSAVWIRDFLLEHPLIKVSLHCHTDTRGSLQKNQLRSERRVQSFFKWLTNSGVDPHRITATKGWGELRPIISEDSILQAMRNNRELVDSLHDINRRITVIIEEVQHELKCSYRYSSNPELIKFYDKGRSQIQKNDRFRLDFIQLEKPIYIDSIEFQKLADFLRCNPSIKFGISVHELLLKENRIMSNEETLIAAKVIIEILHDLFNISEDQLVPIGAGRTQPIIPKVILDQLNSDEEKQAYDKMNRRAELVVLQIGIER